MIRCIRIWTGDDDDSYFEEGVIELPKGERGDILSGTVDVVSISFRETRAGGAFEWHDAPARQFVITLSGTLDFQTRTGDHFMLHPGDILLAEAIRRRNQMVDLRLAVQWRHGEGAGVWCRAARSGCR
jgi:hypothetical protein